MIRLKGFLINVVLQSGPKVNYIRYIKTNKVRWTDWVGLTDAYKVREYTEFFLKGLETLIAVVFCKECVLPVQGWFLFCKGGRMGGELTWRRGWENKNPPCTTKTQPQILHLRPPPHKHFKKFPAPLWLRYTLWSNRHFLAKISYKPYICVIGVDFKDFGGKESIFEVKIKLGTTWKAYTGF